MTTRTRDVAADRRRDGGLVPEQIAVTEDWMIPAMILAIYSHRRRISQLLNRLDDPSRTAVESVVAALIEEKVDAAVVLTRLTKGVCDGEGRMHQLIELLLDTEPPSEASHVSTTHGPRRGARRIQHG
jgi:hypothetical protein